MKKSLFLMLAFMLMISGCGNTDETPISVITPGPTSATPASPTPTPLSQYPDKINDTTYAGRVTEISDSSITILMDEKDSVTFELNDRAKRDIEILKIEVDNRIIIEFDAPETKKILSVQKIQSEL